jgi:hypothetical protein
MVESIFDGLEKLSPEERIKKLKEIELKIEQERTEKLATTQKLIKETQDKMQIDLEKELEKEKSTKIKNKNSEKDLENTVKKEAPKIAKKEESEIEAVRNLYKASIQQNKEETVEDTYKNPNNFSKKDSGNNVFYSTHEKIWERGLYKSK